MLVDRFHQQLPSLVGLATHTHDVIITSLELCESSSSKNSMKSGNVIVYVMMMLMGLCTVCMYIN